MTDTQSGTAESGDGAPLAPHVYGLVLLLQQAAEDAERYAGIADDARRAGDGELADWCEELADSDREIVIRARRMLVPRLGAGFATPPKGYGTGRG